MGKLSAQPSPPTSTPANNPGPRSYPRRHRARPRRHFLLSPPSFPDLPSEPKDAAPGVDYEALTLMRLRQAERERLEREILEQEAAEI
ncbi:hypothetical protein DFH06DRAFT_320001 [Mycena polygramma]|nr:hypothetical protein DFH06DRAFT_320001 [Mycena polygramma]